MVCAKRTGCSWTLPVDRQHHVKRERKNERDFQSASCTNWKFRPHYSLFFFASTMMGMGVLAFGLVGCNAWTSPHRSFHSHQFSTQISSRPSQGFPCFLSSSDSLEDQISAISNPKSGRAAAPSLLDAAAAVIQESCQLLGVKSIGVDYGLVRTGVASTVGYEPKPIGILIDLNNTQLCDQVIRYARAEQASRIIVGLPVHKNGTFAEQTNVTLIFGEELARRVGEQLGPAVSVLWWDERYTSKEAAARARSIDPRTSVYGQLDADAACIILENYYQLNGQDAESVELAPGVREDCLEKWKQERQSIDAAFRESQSKREETMERRKEAIAQARKQDQEMAASAGAENPSRKKKKKKKKKKR